MTSKETIAGWLDRMYASEGITHMVVKCDTYDWSDYPVYVGTNEDWCTFGDVRDADDSQDDTMEIYSKTYTKDAQLAEPRARHFD